jgi:phosphatidylserine/phosphatidylglycerophosphate/cardiolipin synthase-like enzyme/uncharacterized membrane protein YdjX (TVP38/TMEM64 family)
MTDFLDGGTCWRTAQASRFSWLIDGENYFRALRESMETAEHEILIVGWDIDSSVELIRDTDHPLYPSPLARTLEDLVERRDSLNVYVLSWDFAFVYLLERELLPAYRFGWQDRERLHFHLDGKQAIGASHHQKFVVIDGSVAFIGGFDLTKCRWDTREHKPGDPRRVDTDGTSYRAFHDVQGVVAGEPAANLRELGAIRWENATGNSLPKLAASPDLSGERNWPQSATVHGKNVRTGLARTWAMPDGSDTIREVEQLYLAMIAGARHSIYIENQYFTSPGIAAAIGKRLRDADGPEIVLVLPAVTSGWLEQVTMETRRRQLLKHLIGRDDHRRLLAMAPVPATSDDTPANVHAKILIVDDTWCRIGSANLSCRSMGLDSECDIVVEDPDQEIGPALRADLIAEHVGADRNAIRESIRDKGLLATLAAFSDGPRRLEKLPIDTSELDSMLEPLVQLADMEQPLESRWHDPDGADTTWARRLADMVFSRRAGWSFLAAVVLGLLVWGIRVAGDMEGGFDPFALLESLRQHTRHPYAPLAVVPAFVAGSLVVAPVTGMIALCALLFSPWIASLSAIAGTLAATAVNYYVGRFLGKSVAEKAPGKIYERMRSLARSADAWSLAGLRLIPIAPFTVFNLLAGAAHVNLRDLLAGTLLGMGPGIVIICLSVDRARAALAGEPVFDPWIIAAIVVMGLSLVVFRVWQNKRST